MIDVKERSPVIQVTVTDEINDHSIGLTRKSLFDIIDYYFFHCLEGMSFEEIKSQYHANIVINVIIQNRKMFVEVNHTPIGEVGVVLDYSIPANMSVYNTAISDTYAYDPRLKCYFFNVQIPEGFGVGGEIEELINSIECL